MLQPVGMTAAVLGGACLLAVGLAPARAEERPLLTPQRDVDVLYRMAGGDLTQRLRWSEAARTLRVDPPGNALYVLVNYADGRMQWVADQRQEVMELPAPAGAGALVGEGDGRYASLGPDSVAGLPCTEWRTADAGGTPMTLCFTSDGVLLQVARAGQVMLQASSVSYAAQPADAFHVPPSYRHVAPPRADARGNGGIQAAPPGEDAHGARALPP